MVTQQRLKRDERRSTFARLVTSSSGVGIDVDYSAGPCTELGKPTPKIAANQLVLDVLKPAVAVPVVRARVGEACHGWSAAVRTQALRKFIVRASVEQPSGRVLARSAPLLEEERYAARVALTLDVGHPAHLHGSGAWPALSADDYPVDAGQVDGTKILEQRFNRHETDGGRRLAERVEPGQAVLAILNAHTEPDRSEARSSTADPQRAGASSADAVS